MTDLALEAVQLALVAAAAPLVTGFVRWLKARLLRRRGPPPVQPYRDVARLLRKTPVVAAEASWLFRAAPYASLTLTWLAAGLVPSFTSRLAFAGTADLILLFGLLAAARFATALAALDVGTAFGGIGASREMMIGSLAEPAALMVVFTLSLTVHSTSITYMASEMAGGAVGLRVSLALGLAAFLMVGLAENARMPVDNPATHLELTMVHEAMVLEYSGRHLALIEFGQMLKLLLFLSLTGAVFAPFGMAAEPDPAALGLGLAAWAGKLAAGAAALAVFETAIAKLRVFRIAEFLGGALLLGLVAVLFLYVTRAL